MQTKYLFALAALIAVAYAASEQELMAEETQDHPVGSMEPHNRQKRTILLKALLAKKALLLGGGALLGAAYVRSRNQGGYYPAAPPSFNVPAPVPYPQPAPPASFPVITSVISQPPTLPPAAAYPPSHPTWYPPPPIYPQPQPTPVTSELIQLPHQTYGPPASSNYHYQQLPVQQPCDHSYSQQSYPQISSYNEQPVPHASSSSYASSLSYN